MAHAHISTDHPSTQTVLATLAHLGCATLSQLHALCFPQAFASTVRLALIGLAEAGLITHSHWRLTQGERCQVWTITTKGLAQVRRDLPHLAHVHAPDLNRPSTTREKDEWRVRIEVRSWIVRLILEARQQPVCASATLSTSMLYPMPLSPDGPPQPDAVIALAWESPAVQASDWLPWMSMPTNEATTTRYRVYVERIGHPTALERWVGHCVTAAQDSTPLLILATPERYSEVTSLFRQQDHASPIRLCLHQGLSQLVAEVMGALADNAGTRVILGCEAAAASTYAGLYRAMGLTQTDFTQMEVHPVYNYALHQYLKLAGRGNLFSAQPLTKPEPGQEEPPPPVYRNWRTLMAPAANGRDRELDASIARFHELAKVRWDEAVQRLGAVCLSNPAAFDAFCSRTKAHRLYRRQFILDHPGCVRIDPDLEGQAALQQQKVDRIRILSDLGSGVPKLETEAMAFALLMASREASAVRKERAEAAEAKKAAKKGSGTSAKATKSVAPLGAPSPEDLMLNDTWGADGPEHDRAQRTHLDTIPTLEELMSARGKRRSADDLVAGFEEFEPTS